MLFIIIVHVIFANIRNVHEYSHRKVETNSEKTWGKRRNLFFSWWNSEDPVSYLAYIDKFHSMSAEAMQTSILREFVCNL